MFVILAHQRSGTHMLASLLDSHPDLRCYDELAVIGINKRNLILGRKDIFKLKENEGFILMYSQFLRLAKKNPDFINCIKKAKIIHLIRENLDNHIRSLTKAKSKGSRVTKEKRKYFRKFITQRRNNVFRNEFENVFTISYEEICNDKNIKEYENEKLLQFLGVKPYKMTTIFVKGEY